MGVLIGVSIVAFIFGIVLPMRWSVWGFVAAVIVLFAAMVGINFASGFAGSSIEESLLLFNGSYLSYLGFNLQISYRAFAPPLLALAVPLIFRLSRPTD
ncbi:MAG: hypothetical protein MK098_09580 [Marinovum sp.]|nr:hypothetical protein [Marinovum sp.]